MENWKFPHLTPQKDEICVNFNSKSIVLKLEVVVCFDTYSLIRLCKIKVITFMGVGKSSTSSE